MCYHLLDMRPICPIEDLVLPVSITYVWIVLSQLTLGNLPHTDL
jgi:hypothetical protein